MTDNQSSEMDTDMQVRMLERRVNELVERLRLAEEQLMKTHRIAVKGYRASQAHLESDPGGELVDESPLSDASDSLEKSELLEQDEPAIAGAKDSSQGFDAIDEYLEASKDEDAAKSLEGDGPDEAIRVTEPPTPQVPPAAASPAGEPPTPPPAPPIAPPTPVAAPLARAAVAPPSNHSDLESIVLGDEIAGFDGIATDRAALLAGLRCGEPDAGVLVGTLLIFRNAPSDRLPQLLKDIGEAYYRWRPETAASSDLFRQTLIESLQRSCEAAGVMNRIELVQPGDRFDSARHHSKHKGVEVTEVQGWVVVRGNGKPYAKATVQTQ